jgi:hypothetical protein
MLQGNPQRTVLHAVMSKGTPAIVAALKYKIPLDSPLLQEDRGDETASRARNDRLSPRSSATSARRDERDFADEDREQRGGRYADGPRRSSNDRAAPPRGHYEEERSHQRRTSAGGSFSAQFEELARKADEYDDPRVRDLYASAPSTHQHPARDPYAASHERGRANHPRGGHASRDYDRDAGDDRRRSDDRAYRSSGTSYRDEREPRAYEREDERNTSGPSARRPVVDERGRRDVAYDSYSRDTRGAPPAETDRRGRENAPYSDERSAPRIAASSHLRGPSADRD